MSRPNEIALKQALASTPLVQAASSAGFNSLFERGTTRIYRRNTYLFHEGDLAGEMFFVWTGSVEISTNSSIGRRQLHAIVDGPEFVGELGVVANTRRTATARTLADSAVWVIDGPSFLGFLEGEGKAATELLRIVVGRLLDYKHLAEDLVSLDVRGRVAKYLIRVACGESASRDALPETAETPPLTHADVAASLGASREQVTRVLSELRRRGLVQRRRNRYLLTHVPGLRQLANLGAEDICRLV